MKNNSERKTHRKIPAETKWQILKEGRSTNLTISQVCEQYQISPTLFYQWQRQLFENAHLVFENGRKSKSAEDAQQHKIEKLEAKLQRKNEVMAELMEAHTQLKQDLGEL